MNRKLYVIGHKNPDTDSIASAIAYAELKKHQGQKKEMSSCFVPFYRDPRLAPTSQGGFSAW